MKLALPPQWLLWPLLCLLLVAPTTQAQPTQEPTLLVRTPLSVPRGTFDATTQAWLAAHPVVRVAIWGRARPPLHVACDRDTFEGITADVLGVLEQIMGVRVQIHRFANQAEARRAMAEDKVDLLGLSDRLEPSNPLFAPSNGYLLNNKVTVRRINDPLKPSADLSGERVAYLATTAEHVQRIKQQYPKSKLMPYVSHMNALAALAYDQVDAFRTNAVSAEYLLPNFQHKRLVIVEDKAPRVADINFAVSKHHPPLLDAINQALAQIPVADMLRITTNWGLNPDFVIAQKSLDLTPEQSAWISTHRVLKVAVVDTYAPLTFLDRRNRLAGLSADVLEMIERLTGLEVKIVYSDSIIEMVEKLERGEVDMIAALNIGELRLQSNQYTRPYIDSPFVVVTRYDQADIRSPQELSGLRMAIPWGNPLTKEIAREYPQIQLVTVKHATEGLEKLAAGEVEAAVNSQFEADYFINHHFQADLHIASAIGARPARTAMAVRSDLPILKDIINAVLLEIRPDELRALVDRWGVQPPTLASSWRTYNDVVYTVVALAILFALIFLAWNHVLRTNIAERERLAEQLRQANETAINASRSKSIFLASMSHEIRTPVSALVGLLELLRLDPADPQAEESLEVAHQTAQSLLSLIGDILDLSKIEAGEMSPTPQPTDLAGMAQAIHRLFKPNADNKHLDFKLVLEVQNPGILIDKLMLSQVVSNLISNAIKFTSQGSVQLLVRELPRPPSPGRAQYAIQVSDTGIGLTPEQQVEIFEPFVQAEPHTHRAMGTGLGLSICSSLAKLLRARLSVDSQPGIGSRFTLIFEAETLTLPKAVAPACNGTQSSYKLRILVAEDHAANRLLLCKQLEYLGHEVLPCEDGETALKQWLHAAPPFDLTITDCSMPHMDGFALAQAIREAERQRAANMHPIYGLTANALNELDERCREAGMTQCLFKPLSIESLAALLDEVAQTSQRRMLAAQATGSELEKLRLLSPESYAPLIEALRQTNLECVNELQQSVKREDIAAARKVAHKIRGGAQLAGDHALVDACRTLEALDPSRDPTRLASCASDILALVEALEQRLLEAC